MLGLGSYFLVAIRRKGTGGSMSLAPGRWGAGVKTRELEVQGQPGLDEALSQSLLLPTNNLIFLKQDLKRQPFKSSQVHLCVRGILSLK